GQFADRSLVRLCAGGERVGRGPDFLSRLPRRRVARGGGARHREDAEAREIMPAAMFEPLAPGEAGSALPLAPSWRAVLPVPDDAPRELPRHRLGKPARWWVYRGAAGGRLFVVARFDKPDGDKEVLPLTYCEGPEGKREWRWQAPPEPRPLYGLDRLARCPDAPVVVTEGEKAADAAGELFQDCVAITSQGGA